MLRRSFFLTMTFVLAIGLVACDTVTDLGTVNLEGRWDSVGALQAETGGVVLFFNPPDADGTFTGTWRVSIEGASVTGPVLSGSNRDGEVEFTLQGFFGDSMIFNGRLTNRFRMAGDLVGFGLDDAAVFRLSEA